MPALRGTLRAITIGAAALAAASALVASGAGGVDAEPAAAEPAGPAVRLHEDPEAVLAATTATIRGFLAGDAEAARAGLARIAEGTAHLDPVVDAELGGDLLAHALALQTASARARESAGDGRMDDAYRQFQWVQQACFGCHTIARRDGLLR